MSVGTKKNCRLEKSTFCRLGEKKFRWKKIVSWKKNVRWRIYPAIPGNVRTFPEKQDRKTAEAGKNPLGPVAGKKKMGFFVVGWREKMSVGKKMPAVRDDRA